MAAIADLAGPSNSWTAVAQLTALTACVYKDQRGTAEQLLGTDAQVVRWDYRPESWPPSVAYIVQPNRLWIVMAGTVNTGQWIGHLQGSYWYRRTSTTTVNGQWLSVAEAIYDQALDLIPSGAVLGTFGHSYGGAVAQVVAWLAARGLGAARAQHASIAAPRAFGLTRQGPAPAVELRYRSCHDVVPSTPPAVDEVPMLLLNQPFAWRLWHGSWTHHGEQVWLGPDGSSNCSITPPDPLPPGVEVGSVSEHYTANYLGRLLARYQRDGGSDTEGAALATGLQVAGLADGQALVARLPQSFTAPDGTLTAIPSVLSLRSAERVNAMPGPVYPTAVTPDVVMRCRFILNSKGSGVSETWLLGLTSGGSGDPYIAAREWCKLYAHARRKALAEDCSLDAFTISQETARGDSDEVVKPEGGCGQGQGGPHCAEPSTALWLRCTDGSRGIRSYRPYHMFATTDLPNAGTTGPKAGPVNTTSGRAADLLVKLIDLLTTSRAAGGYSARVVLEGTHTNPDELTSLPILGVDNDDKTRVVVTVAGIVSDFTVGTKVRLGHNRRTGVTGFAGYTRIARVVEGQGGVALTLDKYMPHIPGQIMDLAPQLLFPTKGYFDLVHLGWSRISNRNVGGPIGATVGRRSRR